MDFSDKIMLGAMALSLAASALTRLAAYMRERHDSALARLVGFSGRIAGEASATLGKLPPGADLAAVEQSLIAVGVKEGRTEFGPSLAIVGADDAKLATMIQREIAKLPAARVGELVLGAVAAVAAPIAAQAPVLAPA